MRTLLESEIRHCDGFQVMENDVEFLKNTAPNQGEIPFKPARALLHDITIVLAVVDIACTRDAMNKLDSDLDKINSLAAVDLVIDPSILADVAGSANAVQANVELELQHKERFAVECWKSRICWRTAQPSAFVTGIVVAMIRRDEKDEYVVFISRLSVRINPLQFQGISRGYHFS